MPTDLTLYEAEDDLAALVDTAEMVPAEQIEAFEQALVAANASAVEKRAACIRFLRHLENQVELCKAERKRIKAREDSIARNLERFEQYIMAIMEKYVPAPKTGSRKLSAGGVGELVLVKKPDSVVVSDPGSLPAEFTNVTVTFPGDVLADLLRTLEGQISDFVSPGMVLNFKEAVSHANVTARKTDIRKALESGEDVPGADMTCNQYRLEIR